jgi:hypothetical protein
LVPAIEVVDSLDAYVRGVQAAPIGGRGRRAEPTDVDADIEKDDDQEVLKPKSKKVKAEPITQPTQLLTLAFGVGGVAFLCGGTSCQ